MINFGIVYGITAWGLARNLGESVSVEEAAEFINDYKDRFKGIDRFMDTCVKQAVDEGWVETICGRRRMITQLKSDNPQTRDLGKRLAINSVVQGSAADLIKEAMIRLHPKLEGIPGAKLLLQIHDELVVEVPEAEAATAQSVLVETMESAMDLCVPLVVDVASGASWYETK